MTKTRTEKRPSAWKQIGAPWLKARRERTKPDDIGLMVHPEREEGPLRTYEVARAIGCCDRTYRAAEAGERAPERARVTAIGAALKLTDVEVSYLARLAAGPPANGHSLPSPPAAKAVAALVARHPGAAYALDHRWDVLAASALVRRRAPALVASGSLCRWFLTHPEAKRMVVDWQAEAAALVGAVRWTQAFHPHDPAYDAMMTQLADANPLVARLWRDQMTVRELPAVSTCRLRCDSGTITQHVVTRLQPAGRNPGLQVVFLS